MLDWLQHSRAISTGAAEQFTAAVSRRAFVAGPAGRFLELPPADLGRSRFGCLTTHSENGPEFVSGQASRAEPIELLLPVCDGIQIVACSLRID